MADMERGAAPNCWAACTGYTRTRKGMILIVEMILCVVILICYGASSTAGYSALAVCELVMAIVFFVIFMCNFHHQLNFINWAWTDFFRAAIAALLFLITSLIVMIRNGHGMSIAAGVFGFLAAVLFAYDAYTVFPSLYKRHAAAPTESPDGGV
ncbi:proteolipid protein 2 [Tachyglossus aculeatus]|uniref:proteolipid protein 2 n=1 Tax=Tachyglossus aculeatus TaxID=9261 RepID=UPI0018F5600F|nr:proteolipid protein 2 [Tachyglossus aculeatus]